MPRVVEILLFLVPLLGFISWRVLAPSPLPPLWLTYTLAGAVAVLLFALVWLRHIDASDGDQRYRPARLEAGHVVAPQRTPAQ